MGRAPLAVFVAVLLVGAISALSYLTEQREVIVSTPSAYTGLTKPLALPARGETCVNEILWDTDAEIARFGATAPDGAPAPDLEVVAQAYPPSAMKYRSDYRFSTRVPGGWTGTKTLDVPLRPPASQTFGTLCVRNTSARDLELVGSEDGRAFSRPSVTINGQPSPLELQLRLLEPGRKSLLSRVGQLTSHAATLKPFGAWWIWLLALALLSLAPLAVAATIRAAFAADGTLADDRPSPMGAWAPERLWDRARTTRGPVLVAVGLAVALVWLLYWSLNTHVFQNDEDQYVYLSRWLWRDFPQSLWNFDAYGRGLQRLEVWVLAVPGLLTDSPWSLALGRGLNALAFISVAVPVYLLARGLGLRSQWAALPAVLSAIVPWAVVTTAYLTENLAYPAFVWVVYPSWRAANKPSALGDVAALASIFVAGLSRSALLAMAPVLPLTILATALRTGEFRRVWREHVVLWGVIGVAIVLVIPGMVGIGPTQGLSGKLAGGYGTPWNVNLWDLIEKSGRYFSRIAVGTGFFAAAAGVPWLVLALVRSRDRALFSFAVAAVSSALLLFYTLWSAGADERYILYLAPLVLLPAAAALGRGELRPLALGIGSVLTALLILRVPWNGEQGAFGFFIWPVETFYGRTVGERLDRLLPGGSSAALWIVGVTLGLIGVAIAVLLAKRPRWILGAPAVAIVTVVALAIPVQTQYALSKHVNGVGSKSAPGLKARAFADRLTPGGKTVGEFAAGAGQRGDYFGVWQEVQFYNQRIDTVFAMGPNVNAIPPGDKLVDGLGYDQETGRLSSPEPLADYMVVPTSAEGPHLRGEIVTAPGYIPVALLKRAEPASIAWRAEGFGPDARVNQAGGGEIRVYGARCASLELTASGAEAPYEVRTESGAIVGQGTVAPGSVGAAKVDLPPEAASGHADLRLSGTAQLLNVRVGCPGG